MNQWEASSGVLMLGIGAGAAVGVAALEESGQVAQTVTIYGTGEVQHPILPGESFEYRFIVPDAGTFWYHSHRHGSTALQVSSGMVFRFSRYG